MKSRAFKTRSLNYDRRLLVRHVRLSACTSASSLMDSMKFDINCCEKLSRKTCLIRTTISGTVHEAVSVFHVSGSDVRSAQ